MIYEYAGQLVANCLCQHDCCYGGIYAAGQCAEHFTLADLLTNRLNGVLYERIHLPVACTAADFIYEVGQHLGSLYGMQYFRMELDCVKLLLLALCCCHRAVRCVGNDLKARSFFLNVVVMAHPADGLLRYIAKQLAGLVHGYFNLSVLTNRSLADMSAQYMAHELRAIAESQYRNTKLKQLFAAGSSALLVHAVWTASQDNALRIHFFNLFDISLVRINLTIHIALTYTAGNQLVVLTAKVDYNNLLSVHEFSSYLL